MHIHLGNGDRQSPWRDIRKARANVPKGARTATRRALFASSLEQADSLWEASETVGALARPILQYYSLFQIGLALAAASNLSDAAWRPRQSHGLVVHVERTGGEGVLDLRNVIISPSESGMAHTLARVFESPLLHAPVTLAAAIAALPHQQFYKPLDTAETPCIYVRYYDMAVNPYTLTHDASQPRVIDIKPTPAWLPRRVESMTSDGTDITMPGPTWPEVGTWLDNYPNLRGLPEPDEIQTLWTMLEQDGASVLRLIYASENDPVRDLLNRSPVYGDHEVVACPPIGGNDRSQHPLITWFIVLHALSILSRYHSNLWQRVLDLDRSPDAARLREFVEEGTEDCVYTAGRSLSMVELLSDYRYE